ncbi:MAG: DUF3604 domain-containing protein, partial [Proteobacteria bacterium]|nr:DUF3604 domain-containing protein [Pseudomonadota bacterium]
MTSGRFMVAALLAVFACSEVDDPSLAPLEDPRFDAPAPPLRSLPREPRRNVFWGDLHIHTSYSYDAYTFGVRSLPEDAYRYAKGDTIQHAIGYPIRLSRPLDFAAVTDHAEYLGVAREMGEARSGEEATLRDVLATGSPWRIPANYFRVIFSSMSSLEKRDEVFGRGADPAVSSRAWRDVIETAERHNEPGRFPTLLGYEWSSMPEDPNLHRNVIYRSGAVPGI